MVRSTCSVNVIPLLLSHTYLMGFNFMQRQDWEAQTTGAHVKKGGLRVGLHDDGYSWRLNSARGSKCAALPSRKLLQPLPRATVSGSMGGG